MTYPDLTDRNAFRSLVDAGAGIPIVVCLLSAAPVLPVPVPPPPPPKSVMVMSSMLMRLDPPSSLRISNRMLPARLTVKLAVENAPPVVDRDVPTCVHVLRWFCDENSAHVPLASVAKLA